MPFFALAILKVVYEAYALYSLWKHKDQITVAVTYTQYAVMCTSRPYPACLSLLTLIAFLLSSFAGALSLFVRVMLLWYTWLCFRAFGKGLRARGV